MHRKCFSYSKYLTVLLVLPLLGLIFSTGCKKKNRLSANSYDFIINPPATTLVKGSTRTFAAEGTALSGSVSTSPTWDLAPTAGTTISTNYGPSVTILFNQTGNYTLSAAFQDKSAQSQIIVVNSNGLPIGAFNIYTDLGLPTGATVSKSAYASSEITDASAPEGSKYTELNMSNFDFFGVDLNAGSVDLANYTKLVFYIRKDRSTSFQPLVLRMKKTDGTLSPALSTATGDWNSPANGGIGDPASEFINGASANNVWQKVVIDISQFGFGGGSVLVRIPFTMTSAGLIKIDIDDIYLQP